MPPLQGDRADDHCARRRDDAPTSREPGDELRGVLAGAGERVHPRDDPDATLVGKQRVSEEIRPYVSSRHGGPVIFADAVSDAASMLAIPRLWTTVESVDKKIGRWPLTCRETRTIMRPP